MGGHKDLEFSEQVISQPNPLEIISDTKDQEDQGLFTQKPFLGTIEEAPQYIIDNIYILTGYRINFTNFCHSFRSLFMIHNETINIWSHLIGFLIAIGLCVDLALYDPFPGHSMQKWPIYIFIASGMSCMFFSSFYHLFFVVDPFIAKILLRLDYAGISFLICGSAYPCTYYGFYCQPHFLWFYLTLISVAGISVFIVTMMDFIYTEKYFHLKSILYASYGIFVAIPMIHVVIYEQLQPNSYKYSTLSTFAYYIFMAISDYMGLFIYAKRCPEKQYPGKFDICGHSHQIMHISTMLGMVSTYIATIMHYKDRLQYPCGFQ